MTERDRKVLAVVLALVVFGGFWFLVVGKKRSAIKTAEAAQVTAQQQLDQAKAAEIAAKSVAKVKPAAYSRLLRLGKAIPIDKDFESLLVQINDITVDSDVSFVSLTTSTADAEDAKLGGATGSTTCDVAPAAASATPATTTPATGAVATPAGATGSTAETWVGKDRDQAKAAAATASDDKNAEAEAAAAEAAACATSPTLTDLTANAAGLKSESFGLSFTGDFYNLKDVFNGIQDLVKVHNGRVSVTGRLLDINSIALAISTFPTLSATVQMTGYQLPSTPAAAEGAASGTTTPSASAPAAAATANNANAAAEGAQ
jgi:hypothetical protein